MASLISISILYLLDAEKKGIKIRLDTIATEIKEAMKIEEKTLVFTNAGYTKINSIDFGAYGKPGTH